MSVEGAVDFNTLNASLPADTGVPDAQGFPIEGGLWEDPAHARKIKETTKAVFPGSGLNGFNRAIVANEDELDACVGLLSNLQTQLLNARRGSIPIGGVIAFFGQISQIPSNFALCDGTNGTPLMSDNFTYATLTEGVVNQTGGSDDMALVAHTHDATHGHGTQVTDPDGDHLHGNNFSNGGAAGSLARNRSTTGSVFIENSDPGGSHDHGVSLQPVTMQTSADGADPIGRNVPPFRKFMHIQRKS